MSDHEHDEKHNPGEPEFGEGHDEDAPHNPGEPTFGDDEPTDADSAAESAEGHA